MLSRRFGTSVGVGLAAFALVASSLLIPRPAIAATGASSHKDVDQAISFRGRLGLRADRAFVASTFGNARFKRGMWGVPLDPGESAEVDRRADVQRASERALREAGADPQAAGAYFDQASGGEPVFLTAGDVGKARAAIRAKLPQRVAARFERVRFSMADLEALQRRVNEDLAGGRLAALGVTSTAIDARSNAVAVGVATATDATRADLAARYGDGLDVATEAPSQGGDAGGACSSRKSCPPAKGGLQIDSTYNGFACTIGLMVRVAGDSDPRLLTAGHCVTKTGGTGTSRKWLHNGVDFGWSEASTWTDGANADAGLIKPTAAAIAGDRNLAYESSSSDIKHITSWKATAAQIQGSLLCRGGAVSNYVCGEITLTNRTKDVDGRTIDHQWVVDFDACPGDSGAPYFSGNVAFGIHTDSTAGCAPGTNQAWYSPIGWILDVLAAAGHPISICTDATCGGGVNAWTARGSLDGAVSNPRLVTLADARILALPGGDSEAAAGAAQPIGPEIYDPSTHAWTDTAAAPWLPDACVDQAVVALGNGAVLVAGGSVSGTIDACSDAAFTYDPTNGPTGAWAAAADVPAGLSSAGGVLLEDGRVLVVGVGEGGAPVAAAYDPGKKTWTARAAPPSIGSQPALARLGNGRVVLAGTTNEAGHIYDPSADTWTSTAAIGGPGAGITSLADGRVVVGGGIHDSTGTATLTTKVSVFTPSTGKWTTLAPLRAGRAGFGLDELPDGRLIAIGGLLAAAGDPDGTATKTVDVYDWTRNAWYAAPSLAAARSALGSVVLDDGDVLAAAGGLASTETYTPGDVIPPLASAPTARLRSGTTISSTSTPIALDWTASDLGGSGYGTYDVARSTDGGAYSTIASNLLGSAYNTTVAPDHTYRFEVRARDWAGNVGPWKAAASTVKVGVTQQTSGSVTWSGSWTTASFSSYSGGSVRYSKSAGAKASYDFTGRGVAFVTERGPSRGSAKVYIDGVLAATINTNSSSKTYRYVAFQQSWSSSGSHRISVVVSGTSGHPRVDVDAFLVQTAP